MKSGNSFHLLPRFLLQSPIIILSIIFSVTNVYSAENSPTLGQVAFTTNFRAQRYFTPCSVCHNIREESYEIQKKPGPPLANSWFRQSFKNKKINNLADAIADCMELYQLRLHTADLQNISAYLKSVSTAEITSSWDYDITSQLPEIISGNILQGQIIYENSCLPCHQQQKTSFLKNPLSREFIFEKTRGLLPNQRAELNNMTDIQISEAPKPIMKMPAFGRNRLSDDDLADLAEFITHENRMVFDELNIYPPATASHRTNLSQKKLHKLLRKLRPPRQIQPANTSNK